MKKRLLISLIAVVSFYTASAVIIVDPDQGINTNALTNAVEDNPTETVFELKRDGVYVVDKEYTFKRELELRAQTGTGIMPMIIVVADQTGEKPSQVFKVEGNLTVNGIYFNGDTRGNGIVSHMFRATAGSLNLSFDNCYFDRIEQTVVRLDVKDCSVAFDNCIFRNIAQTANIDNGRIVDSRGQEQNEISFMNSTFYNNVGQVYRYSGSAIVNKLTIDHCSLFNSGYRMSLDLAINGTYTNNIMANCHWKASFSSDGGVTPPEVGSVLNIDSLNTEMDSLRTFIVSNNNIFDTQPLTDAYNAYPSKVVKRQLIDSINPWVDSKQLIMANNISEVLDFKNPSPMPLDFIKSFFESAGSSSFNTTANNTFYVEEEVGKDAPEVATPFDFSYGNDMLSAKASTTGGQLGDPRWVLIKVVGSNNLNSMSNVRVFPNPVADFLNISFGNSVSAKINMYDLEGKSVYYNQKFQSVNAGETVQINMQNLPKGNYLYSIEIVENGQMKRANGKVIK
jgi:hypothetical protein